MTSKTVSRHARLATLARMISDHALAQLAQCEQDCRMTCSRLAALDPAPTTDPLVPPQALAAAALRHERWAEPQRIQLNQQLARQTAARIAAEQLARKTFGRAQVLERLAKTAKRS